MKVYRPIFNLHDIIIIIMINFWIKIIVAHINFNTTFIIREDNTLNLNSLLVHQKSHKNGMSLEKLLDRYM